MRVVIEWRISIKRLCLLHVLDGTFLASHFHVLARAVRDRRFDGRRLDCSRLCFDSTEPHFVSVWDLRAESGTLATGRYTAHEFVRLFVDMAR